MLAMTTAKDVLKMIKDNDVYVILQLDGFSPESHRKVRGRDLTADKQAALDMLRALDIYTGRLLWEARLPGVGKVYDNTSHQPGANATGTNYVSLSDGIYVICDRVCVRLDPATGRNLSLSAKSGSPVPPAPTQATAALPVEEDEAG